MQGMSPCITNAQRIVDYKTTRIGDAILPVLQAQ